MGETDVCSLFVFVEIQEGKMLIKVGTGIIVSGALISLFKSRWAVWVFLAGAILTMGGLTLNCYLSDGFHFSLVASKTFLFAPIWAFLSAGLLAKGMDWQGRCLAPGILFVSCMALGSSLPDQSVSLKVASVSAPIFFVTETVATVLFASASLLGIYCVVKKEKLPEPLTGNILVVGFVVFSVCQLAGAWWAWLGWAVPFHWSHRHLIGAAVWCAYSGALHLRFTGWSGTVRAWILSLSIIPLAFPWVFRLRDLIEATLSGGAR